MKNEDAVCIVTTKNCRKFLQRNSIESTEQIIIKNEVEQPLNPLYVFEHKKTFHSQKRNMNGANKNRSREPSKKKKNC